MQNTNTGHLFLLLKDDRFWKQPDSCIESKERFCANELDSILNVDYIAGIYLVPAFYSPFREDPLTISLLPGEDQYWNISLVSLYQHIYDYSSLHYLSDSNERELFVANHRTCLFHQHCSSLSRKDYLRASLLTYWEFQRKCQIWLSQMYLPSLSKNRPSLSPFAFAESNELCKVVRLPKSFIRAVKERYLHRRHQAVPESMISMVFNQYESPTYYLPLNPSDLLEMEGFVRREVSEWLNISEELLQVTSSYGIREYRKDAIIRWHVDPIETQPITAIIHIADDDRCSGEELIKAEQDDCFSKNWPLFVPRSKGFDIESIEYQEIVLREGEALLLQSAKFPHARLSASPLTYYANAFVHLRVKGWEDSPEVLTLV